MSENKTPPTKEELKEKREKAIEHFNEQIPFLTKQAEYEKLLADIEESRTKRLHFIYQQASLAGQGNDEPEPDKKRELKKV